MWIHGMGGATAWWMWVLMALAMIGFWLMVAALIRLLLSRANPAPEHSDRELSRTPQSLLDERLASGEIAVDEYQRLRQMMSGGAEPLPPTTVAPVPRNRAAKQVQPR